MSATEEGATGILVSTKIFPLAFLLLLFKTNISIDGDTSVLKWGDHFFAVPPGAHEVSVSFRYLFSSQTGKATIGVEVVPGRATTILYRSPFLVFMGGTIKVVGA